MDTHRLRISVSNMKNANTREELELIKATVLKNLRDLDAAPSAQLAPRPPAFVKVGSITSSLLHSPMSDSPHSASVCTSGGVMLPLCGHMMPHACYASSE